MAHLLMSRDQLQYFLGSNIHLKLVKYRQGICFAVSCTLFDAGKDAIFVP
jgi:hypothetical protein